MAKNSFFQIRGSNSLRASILLGAVPIAALIGIWWYLTRGQVEQRVISPLTLPSPGEVLGAIGSLIGSGNLPQAILASFRRVAVGFLIALALALPLGVAMGSFGRIKAMFSPIAVVGGYLPIAALVPLTLSWCGTGEVQKYVFLAIAFFVYLLPLIVEAMDKVDEVYLHTASTLGASRWQVVTRVLFPIAFFDIWQAMRLAFGVGWTYIILAEIVFSEAGLGQMITIAQRRGPREYMYLVILIIALLAWLTDKVWVAVGNRLFPYKVKVSA
jgi:NitT/TauT family transport system permease protein